MARGGKHGFKLNSWVEVWCSVRLTATHHPKIENHQPFAVRIHQEKPIAGKDDHDDNNSSNGANDDGNEKNNSHGGDDDDE